MKFVSVLLVGTISIFFSAGTNETRPNIIIILVDDMGYNDVGFHSGCISCTPHLTSIAQNGIQFTNAYVTAPQCSPSRAALLTGIYHQRFGHESNDEFLVCLSNTSTRIIPEYLKSLDYTTGMFGKWNLGDRPNPPDAHGFDESYAYFHYEDETNHGRKTITIDNKNITGRQYATTVIFQKTSQFIQKHKDHPFFIYLAPMSPHPPLVFHPKYQKVFETSKGNIIRRKSLAMINELDDGIGSILNILNDLALQNTLLFFINDNGGAVFKSSGSETLNTPLRGYKGEVYEGGVRVAMAIQWPLYIPYGIKISHPVSSLDVLATILDITKFRNTTKNPLLSSISIDGQSFLRFIPIKPSNTTSSPSITSYKHTKKYIERYFFWRFWMKNKMPKRAARLGDWKWVRIGNANDELYNITADIAESKDLSALYPEVVAKIAKAHRHWESAMPRINRNMTATSYVPLHKGSL
eukprot:gene4664-9251_t